VDRVTTTDSPPRGGAIGLNLIVAYKLTKAGVEVVLGVLLLSLRSAGLTEQLRAVALAIRHHTVSAWSIALAGWLTQLATGRSLRVVAVASFLDAAFSLLEGWALYRGYRWSRWLIIGSTAFFIPFEIVALTRRLSAGRVLLLTLNVAVVIYLIARRDLGDAGSAGEARSP
jgi:uncharacterized membrane protein (DUF2068 family)